jgi:integrase
VILARRSKIATKLMKPSRRGLHRSTPLTPGEVPPEKQYQSHPRTYLRYRESTKPLLTFFEKLRLGAVSMALVEKFKITRSTDVASATFNRDLAALRLILNLAIRKEYLAKNPIKEVQFLDEGPGHMRIVSHEEQRKYMAAASPLLRDVATLIAETGMRPEEVFNIRKENVHFAPPCSFRSGRLALPGEIFS